MSEELIYIKNNDLQIEGLLHSSSSERGVVICHPHSLMGGSMYNNVVETIQQVFAHAKYTTVRFNFRGVGRSTGSYDEGRGEESDISTVCQYMQDSGIKRLSFAGYSFGSWVGSKIIEKDDNPFDEVIFISPPINYFNFNFKNLNNKINLIICGSHDQFCDTRILTTQAQSVGANMQIIAGADHFYFGREKKLENILIKKITSKV